MKITRICYVCFVLSDDHIKIDWLMMMMIYMWCLEIFLTNHIQFNPDDVFSIEIEICLWEKKKRIFFSSPFNSFIHLPLFYECIFDMNEKRCEKKWKLFCIFFHIFLCKYKMFYSSFFDATFFFEWMKKKSICVVFRKNSPSWFGCMNKQTNKQTNKQKK